MSYDASYKTFSVTMPDYNRLLLRNGLARSKRVGTGATLMNMDTDARIATLRALPLGTYVTTFEIYENGHYNAYVAYPEETKPHGVVLCRRKGNAEG